MLLSSLILGVSVAVVNGNCRATLRARVFTHSTARSYPRKFINENFPLHRTEKKKHDIMVEHRCIQRVFLQNIFRCSVRHRFLLKLLAVRYSGFIKFTKNPGYPDVLKNSCYSKFIPTQVFRSLSHVYFNCNMITNIV